MTVRVIECGLEEVLSVHLLKLEKNVKLRRREKKPKKFYSTSSLQSLRKRYEHQLEETVEIVDE